MSDVRFTALIADDDPTVRLLARAALAGHGFAVTAVADGGAAQDELVRQTFDIVLLDGDMPVVDGYRVCRELRRRAGPVLPIVLITGHADRSAALASGANDFIAKPVDWAGLGPRLRGLLGDGKN